MICKKTIEIIGINREIAGTKYFNPAPSFEHIKCLSRNALSDSIKLFRLVLHSLAMVLESLRNR